MSVNTKNSNIIEYYYYILELYDHLEEQDIDVRIIKLNDNTLAN